MALEPEYPSYSARIDNVGRITLPADLRHRYGLHAGDDVVIVSQPDGVEIKTYDQVLSEAQDRYCRAAPASRVLSEELLAERRQDAALEGKRFSAHDE